MNDPIGPIEQEWRALEGKLSPEERQDGRRCFYCGVLMLLAEFTAGRQINISALDREIRAALKVMI